MTQQTEGPVFQCTPETTSEEMMAALMRGQIVSLAEDPELDWFDEE